MAPALRKRQAPQSEEVQAPVNKKTKAPATGNANTLTGGASMLAARNPTGIDANKETKPSPERSEAWLERLERETDKTLSIETVLTNETLAKCHLQEQSPLFSRFSAEIRNSIFAFALSQNDNPAHYCLANDCGHRPGFCARRVVSTSLLLTCRRVWLEANHLPMEQSEQSFWFTTLPLPPWTGPDARGEHAPEQEIFEPHKFCKSLTPNQFAHLRHIRFSVEIPWLSFRAPTKGGMWYRYVPRPFWYDISPWGPIHLDTFTLTVRRCSLSWGDYYESVDIHEQLISDFMRTSEACSISEFHLELEGLAENVRRLEQVVDSLRRVGEPNESGQEVRFTLVQPIVKTTWSGPKDLGGKPPHEHLDEVERCRFAMVWRLTAQAKQEQAAVLSQYAGPEDAQRGRTTGKRITRRAKKQAEQRQNTIDAKLALWHKQDSLLMFIEPRAEWTHGGCGCGCFGAPRPPVRQTEVQEPGRVFALIG